GAVRLFPGFHQRHEEARQRGAAAIKDVRENIVALLVLKTEAHPARLEILAIRAARHLEELSLTRRPDLNVVGHGAGEAHIAGAELNDPVMKPQQLQD